MNREIKFRGISKRTREWVYGYYWTNYTIKMEKKYMREIY